MAAMLPTMRSVAVGGNSSGLVKKAAHETEATLPRAAKSQIGMRIVGEKLAENVATLANQCFSDRGIKTSIDEMVKQAWWQKDVTGRDARTGHGCAGRANQDWRYLMKWGGGGFARLPNETWARLIMG
jgi:hypothetical protein